MPHSLIAFIWMHSKWRQIAILAVTLLSFPFLYATLDIPSRSAEERRASAELLARELSPSSGQVLVGERDFATLHQTTIDKRITASLSKRKSGGGSWWSSASQIALSMPVPCSSHSRIRRMSDASISLRDRGGEAAGHPDP